MKLYSRTYRASRRGMVAAFLASAATATLGLVGSVAAQEYPSANVRIVVTVPPGGQTDVLARTLAEGLAKVLKGNVLVENIGGAGGSMAAANVSRSRPDGYSVLLGTIGTQVVNPLITSNLPYKVEDLAPVVLLASASAIIVAHPSFPANNIAELIAMAKAKPGEIQFATPGIGTSGHLQGELLKWMAGINMTAVHYRGAGPMKTDLIGGHIKLAVDGLPGQLGSVQANQLKALGMSDSKRSALAPDIPTIAETVPGFEVTAWWGFYVPKGTPAAVVQKLNAAANAALAEPGLNKKLVDMGFRILGGTVADLNAFSQAEMAKWQPVIASAGIKSE